MKEAAGGEVVILGKGVKKSTSFLIPAPQGQREFLKVISGGQ